MKELIKAVNVSLKSGWKMTKQISSGSYGFLSSTPPTYDNRTVHTFKDLMELNKKGFSLEEEAGLLALNILLSLCEEEK